jgi:hypothetical protein
VALHQRAAIVAVFEAERRIVIVMGRATGDPSRWHLTPMQVARDIGSVHHSTSLGRFYVWCDLEKSKRRRLASAPFLVVYVNRLLSTWAGFARY